MTVDATRETDITMLQTMCRMYRALAGKHPSALQDLTKTADLDNNGKPDGPFLEKIPIDPKTGKEYTYDPKVGGDSIGE